MRKEQVWRVVLFFLAVFFMLNSFGYLRLVDYKRIADFLGMGPRTKYSAAFYGLIIGYLSIFLLFANLVVELVFLIIFLISKKEFEGIKTIINTIVNKTEKFFNLKERGYSLYNNGVKIMTGMIISFIVLEIFLMTGIFSCYTVHVPSGYAQYCGTEEQLTFLLASMICLSYALLPKEIPNKVWRSKVH